MIVAKFGGSVLDGADGLARACDEIGRLPAPMLVVVSAFADVTNRLERIAAHAVTEPAVAQSECASLVADHRAVAVAALSAVTLAAWEEAMAPLVARLSEVVEGLSIVGHLSPRTLDLIVHFGERFSSTLVHAALRDQARAAEHVSALDVIITDTGHRYARPDIALTRERVVQRLVPALRANDIVVTEGYIARSTSGEATTMGRESSDYSATLLAELIGASSVTIYTSVPGVLTADPQLVPDARTIERMSYGMANLLAELGAKILHPRTVAPAERANIPLVITSIGGASTTISSSEGERCSIAFMSGALLVTAWTDTAHAPVEGFVRAIAETSPVVWMQRLRRRLQVVAVGGEIGTAARRQAAELCIAFEVEPVALLSLVSEHALDGGDMARMIDACGGLPPRALMGCVAPGAVSMAVPTDGAAALLGELHHRCVGVTEGAVPWQALQDPV